MSDTINHNDMKTPAQWCELLKVRIMDPDGWREDGKDWNEPINIAEFQRRTIHSTVQLSSLRAFAPIAQDCEREIYPGLK